MTLDSNIELKSSNNTHLNIIKLCFYIYFFNLKIIESENLVLTLTRKLDFLSEEKISERSRFVNKDVVFMKEEQDF